MSVTTKILSRSTVIAIVLAPLMTACNDEADSFVPPIEQAEFAPFKMDCFAMFHSFCPGRRSTSADDWAGDVLGIEGFTWDWGYHTVVEYRTFPVEEPLQDGPSIVRKLERVVSQEPVDANYEFTLGLRASSPYKLSDATDRSGVYLIKLGENSYQYFNTPVVCEEPQVCGQLDEIIELDLDFVASFTLSPPNTLPLVLKSIECTRQKSTGFVQCAQMAGLSEIGYRDI